MILEKTLTASSKQSWFCYPTEHKNKVSRLAIPKKWSKTSEQSMAITYIVLHVD